MSRRALRVISKAGDVADVYVDGVIGDETTAASFREQLAGVKGCKTLRVHINSEGGSVTEGMAIYAALRSFDAHKVGMVEGIAASMGSVILMACDERQIAKGAFIMIHNPSTAVEGGPDELSKAADVMGKIRDEMLDIYESRTGMKRAELEKLVTEETYFTADEAIASGIADKAIDFEARITLKAVALLGIAKVPASLRQRARHVALDGGVREVEAAVSGALREAYPYENGGSGGAYLIDLYDDSVVFDLDGVIYSQAYKYEDGVAKLDGEKTKMVRKYVPAAKLPAALRARAKGKPTMDEEERKAQIAKLKGKIAELEALGEGDDSEEEEKKPEHDAEDDSEAEGKEDCNAKGEDDDDKDGEDKEEAKALASLVKTLTGKKSLGEATGALVALVSKSGATVAAARAEQVDAAIKGGKLPPALKRQALGWTDKVWGAYVKGMGGATALKLGATHKQPTEANTNADEPTEAELKVGKAMGLTIEQIKASRTLPAVAKAGSN